jgi:hypothetical protein
MPLPQQVGAVEALAVIINEFPGFLSIKDQHFLSFLSELLKMCSVSDGEVSWYFDVPIFEPFTLFAVFSYHIL